MSEFDMVRTDLSALRADIERLERHFVHLGSKIDLTPNVTTILALRDDVEALRTNIERHFTHLGSKIEQKRNLTTIAALRTDIEAQHTNIERRFTHLESKIDQKPNITTIFLAMLITMVLTIGIVGAAAVLVIRL
jgi:hypothetical protein